jgi:hypothetical protein
VSTTLPQATASLAGSAPHAGCEGSRMNEHEFELLLNKSTKLIIRGYPGKSAVLEIRRTVHSFKHGYGWLTESQAFLEEQHIAAIRDHMASLASSATLGKEP